MANSHSVQETKVKEEDFDDLRTDTEALLQKHKVKRIDDLNNNVKFALAQTLFKKKKDIQFLDRIMPSSQKQEQLKILCDENPATVGYESLVHCGSLDIRELINILYDIKERECFQVLIGFYLTTEGAVKKHQMEQDKMQKQTEQEEMTSPIKTATPHDPNIVRQAEIVEEAKRRSIESDDNLSRSYSSSKGVSVFSTSSSCTHSLESSFSHSFSLEVEDNFYSPESNQFWNNIPGLHVIKLWSTLFDNLKKTFPNDDMTNSKKSREMQLMLHVLKIKGDKREEIAVDNFTKLLGWFGPFKQDKESGRCICLMEIKKLIDGSSRPSSDRSQVISWFAGHMNKAEATDKLNNEEAGTFLVRFSSQDACFALSVAIGSGLAPQHYLIECNPEESAGSDPYKGKLKFREEEEIYSDLIDLYNKRLRGTPVDTDYPDVYCSTWCLNLPLNSMMTGYKQKSKNSQTNKKRSENVSSCSNRSESPREPTENDDGSCPLRNQRNS